MATSGHSSKRSLHRDAGSAGAMSADVTPHGRVEAEMQNLAEAVLSPERKRSPNPRNSVL